MDAETKFSPMVTMAEILLKNSPAGVAVYEGLTGDCLLANQAVADMVGGSVASLRRQNFRNLDSWREVGLDELAEATLNDGLPRRHEATLQTSFGKLVSLDFFISRIDVEGQPHLMFIVSDVTERKRAEKALKVKERELETLVENIPDLIVRYNRHLRRIYVNPAWEKASGLCAKEVVNVPIAEIPKVPVAFHAEYMRKLRTVLKTGIPQTEEFTWVNACGKTLFLEYVMVPEYNRTGRIIGVLCVGHDLTDRKKTEEELLHRTVQLEAANKEMHAFTYTVSHDLRAPLRHIDGFLELLKKNVGAALNEQGRHCMDAISEAAQKMGRLIDDLLNFSHMGRHAMSFQQVALGSLVRDIIQELEPDTAGRNITWHIGELPAVSGDAAMLRMVLGDLIANALKFTRSREKALIEIGSLPGQNAKTVIFVRDNGVGFDMTYGDKLFGVFQRLHRIDEFEGTGIGLAKVHRLIARHGGRTWAEGKPDQGATFFIALPQPPQGVKIKNGNDDPQGRYPYATFTKGDPP